MTRPSARTLADPSDTHLERAREALAKQDFAGARDLLIAAWRLRRLPAIANLVDIVAARAPDAVADRLAAVVTPRVATTVTNWRAVRALDDPRVSRFAIDALLRLPFQGPSARPLLQAFVEVVDARGDARIVDVAPSIVAGVTTRVTPLAARTELVKRIRRVTEHVVVPEPTAAESTALAQLAKLVEPLQRAARSAATLLADVYANPDDDAPRLVLADLLMERGDPRGELIVLQIERARSGAAEPGEREQVLLKKHGKAWLGTLAPVLSWGKGYAGTRFRRGFVSTADIILSVGKKLEPLREDPAWSTVEVLDGSWPTDLLWTAPLPALRHIDRPIAAAALARLARRPLAGVRSLRISNPAELDAGLFKAAFPNVERAALWSHEEQWRDLDLVARLGVRVVEVTHNWCENEQARARVASELEAFVAALVGRPAALERVSFGKPYVRYSREETIELRRDAHGRFERV